MQFTEKIGHDGCRMLLNRQFVMKKKQGQLKAGLVSEENWIEPCHPKKLLR